MLKEIKYFLFISFSIIVLVIGLNISQIKSWYLRFTGFYPPLYLSSGLEKAIEDQHVFSIVENGSYVMIKDENTPQAIPMMWLAPETNPELRNLIGKKIIIDDALMLSPQQIEENPKVFFVNPEESNDYSAIVVQINKFSLVN